jgi:lauroyl/myristoyl acyltransferase
LVEKTQEIAAVFEKAVARYPDQWYHFFDYWNYYAA